jgi:adenylate cyclase
MGEVTYGNVGTAERLDFTVIGPAANEVARLGELCKELRQDILVSQDVARYLDGGLHSLGRHCLRGIQESHELFTILDENS